MPGGHPQYPGGGQQQGLHAGYRPSNYGQRNYGYRSSGRSRSHNSSLSSHGSAAAGHKPSAADFALTNGLVRSSGRSSSRRSSKRRQRPRPAMSDTASTVSNTSSVSNQRSSTMSSSVAGGAGYTPYSPPARSSDDPGVTPSGRHRGGKKGGPFANMTGRGIGATIGIVAGIISGGTGLMMLVMGFSGAGGAAMYFVGAFLIVGGIVGIAVGAGICMCCKRTGGQTDNRDDDSRDAEDASMEVQSSPQTAASSNNNYKYPKTNGSSSMLTGGGALNTAYVEDASDSVPTVAAHVPPQYPSNPYTPQPPPAANTGRVPVTLQVPSVAQPQPVSSFSEAQASVVLSRGPAASFQPIQAAPSVATETAARPTPTTLVFEPVVKKPATVQQQQQQEEEDNKSSAVMQQNNVGSGSHNKSVVKPRPTLLPLTNVPPPPPAAELTSGRPAVKLPVPIRSPVINMNPMPPAKKSKQQKQQQWAAGGGGGTPQSSFSDTNNTDASNSSADESGLRGGSTGNSSMETDASTTGEGEGRRGQKVKKRVSFSDEKKGSKAKRKKKLRQSLEHESSNSANESGGPRGILAKKVDSEDLRYVSAPERVRENTQLNRGRERSSSRDRNSRRTSRSRSPGQRPPLHPGGQPTHPATAAGKRGRQPTGPAPLQTHRPKPPLDTSDPAVQSRQRRNSRRKKVPSAGSPSPHDGEVASLSQVRFSFGGQGAAAGGDGGYVNAALEMDSPTSPAAASLPMATSSPTPLHQQNTSNHGNLVFESPPPSSWQPAGRSTPPTPNTSVQLVALHTNSSTETEI